MLRTIRTTSIPTVRANTRNFARNTTRIMSSYTSSWPKDQPQDSALAKFFEDFYKISDTPDAHEKYAEQFTEDAKLIMVSKEANGRAVAICHVPITLSLQCESKISNIPEVYEQMPADICTEILAVRKAMWEKVSARQHKPLKIYPFGSSSDEVMLHGTVEYSFREGGKGAAPWAARAHLVKSSDTAGGSSGYKMDFYQVYLDSALQARKI